MVLEYDFGPVLETSDGFLLIFKNLLHLDLAVTHILAYFLKGFLLPLDDIEAQIWNFSKIGSKIFSKSLPIRINTIIGKTFLLNFFVLLLIVRVRLQLLFQLLHQKKLNFDCFLAGFQLLAADTVASVVEKSVVGVDFKLADRFSEEFWELLKGVAFRWFLPQLGGIKILQPIEFHEMLFLDVVHTLKVEFGLIKFFLALGVDDALDDGLDDDEIVEYEYEVVIVDFLDILSDEASLLVEHLPVGDDLGLAGGALLMFLFEFWEVVVDENLIVERDGISVWFVPVDDVSQLAAVLAVYVVFLVVVFLLQHVLVELVLAI